MKTNAVMAFFAGGFKSLVNGSLFLEKLTKEHLFHTGDAIVNLLWVLQEVAR